MSAARRGLHRLARRAARGLPAGTREVAAALAARAVDGPGLLPGPPPGPVLVLAPHPDDEVIGPGGALARHADAGDQVTVLLATSGEATGGGSGDTAAAREAETAAALRVLGVAADPVCARLPDGGLAPAVDDLARLLRVHGAGAATVYAPSVLDPHRDHRAANAALARAGLPATVFGYEVWAPGPVDALLDVTAVFARKQAALACYATALETVDYVRAATGLAAYRSVAGMLGGRGYAEGFMRLDTAQHTMACETLGLLG